MSDIVLSNYVHSLFNSLSGLRSLKCGFWYMWCAYHYYQNTQEGVTEVGKACRRNSRTLVTYQFTYCCTEFNWYLLYLSWLMLAKNWFV